MKNRRSYLSAFILTTVMSVGYAAMPAQFSPSVSVSAVAKLSAPSGITYTSTTDTITLKWDSLSGAEAYKVYASSEDIDVTSDTQLYTIGDDLYFVYKSVKNNRCVVEGLTKGKTYHFVVAALDKNGSSYIEGNKSGIIKAKTKTAVLPKAPSASYTGTATSGGKTYYFKDGKLAKGFIKTSGGYMYFDGETYQMKTGLMTKGGATYYFGSDGIMYTNGSYKIDGKTYEFGSDGKAKVKSTSAKTDSQRYSVPAFPSMAEYGFVVEESDSFDICGGVSVDIFSDNLENAGIRYLKAFTDAGFSFKTITEKEEDDGGCYWHERIYYGNKHVGDMYLLLSFSDTKGYYTIGIDYA